MKSFLLSIDTITKPKIIIFVLQILTIDDFEISGFNQQFTMIFADSSIKNLKGENRPIVDENSRAILLAALSFVDSVVLFSEQTPLNLIAEIKPDILAKGGDYKITEIVGYEVVRQNGGEAITIPLIEGFSSTNIIDKIQNG